VFFKVRPVTWERGLKRVQVFHRKDNPETAFEKVLDLVDVTVRRVAFHSDIHAFPDEDPGGENSQQTDDHSRKGINEIELCCPNNQGGGDNPQRTQGMIQD